MMLWKNYALITYVFYGSVLWKDSFPLAWSNFVSCWYGKYITIRNWYYCLMMALSWKLTLCAKLFITSIHDAASSMKHRIKMPFIIDIYIHFKVCAYNSKILYGKIKYKISMKLQYHWQTELYSFLNYASKLRPIIGCNDTGNPIFCCVLTSSLSPIPIAG